MLRTLLFVISLFVAGCASTKFQSNVSGLASPEMAGLSTFQILPLNDNVVPTDLQFQEYAAYLERALIDRGFSRADRGSQPDLAIFLGYGIGDPQTHTGSYSMPHFGQTGISSATTTGTISSYGNTSTFSGTTTFTPSYGITGYSTHTYSYTSFTRYVLVDAVIVEDYITKGELKPAFRTSIVSTGSSGDLRRVLPVMIAAAADSFGTNTGQAIEVILTEEDPRVLRIKGLR